MNITSQEMHEIAATQGMGVQTDAAGSFVILTFTIKDSAGNTTAAQLRLNVSFDAILIKDVGRRNLPTIQPSTTLEALLNRP